MRSFIKPEAKKLTQQKHGGEFKCKEKKRRKKEQTSSKQTIITAIMYNRKRIRGFNLGAGWYPAHLAALIQTHKQDS